MLDLADRLASTPVRVHGVRVTNVKIDMARYPGLAWYLRALYAMKSRFSISPEEMARTYVWLAVHERPGQTTGGYWDRIDAPAQPSRWASDETNRAALRKLTHEQLGLANRG